MKRLHNVLVLVILSVDENSVSNLRTPVQPVYRSNLLTSHVTLLLDIFR